MPFRSRSILALSLLAALGLTACVRTIPDATPADIPALETALAASPDNPEVQTRLGVAYFRANRFEDSRTVLNAAVEDGAQDGPTYLYLGLANEELESWTEARQSYSEYLQVGQSGPLQGQIEDRLRLIARRELEAQAANALAAEDQLSGQPPTPRSVAVLPLRLVTDNPDLEPLSVALADMIITDLALSNALTVLERTQVQALVDEMNMTEAGLTESATGARAGRMLRAEHVVQGAATTIGAEGLRLDADLLNTVQGQSAGSVSGEETLEALFDMEKQIVFDILDLLGVELTPAERQAIDENRASNLLAFLAYGRGLQALDNGNYGDAQAAFGESLSLDPGFGQAAAGEDEAGSMDRQAPVTPTGLGDQGSGEFGGTIAPATPARPGGLGGTLGNVDNGVNPSPTAGQIDRGTTGGTGTGGGQTRDPVQESTGQDGRPSTTTTTIRITIPRPTGVGIMLGRLMQLGGGIR